MILFKYGVEALTENEMENTNSLITNLTKKKEKGYLNLYLNMQTFLMGIHIKIFELK